MADKPKDYVIHNRAPDGEFTCVHAIKEETHIELVPPDPPTMRAPPLPTFPPMDEPKLWEWIWIGFVCALIIAWDILKVIAAAVAIIVAAALVGYGIWYLTQQH